MAKELFAGQRKNKYKIVISKEAISRKNIAPLLKMHKKTLIISDDGLAFSRCLNAKGVVFLLEDWNRLFGTENNLFTDTIIVQGRGFIFE